MNLNCQNCKYWGRVWDGVCDVTEGDSINGKGTNYSIIQVDVIDDSGLSVKFHTGPDFGCSKFESTS